MELASNRSGQSNPARKSGGECFRGSPHIWCHSGTGLTRRPFKPEIRGSSPRGITSNYKPTEKRRSMNTGVEIVNALFEHLGMAVSVTAETISEWWPILVSKWAALEIATSCVWLALGLVFVIGAIIALVKMAHAYTHYQDSKLDYDEIGCICFAQWLSALSLSSARRWTLFPRLLSPRSSSSIM